MIVVLHYELRTSYTEMISMQRRLSLKAKTRLHFNDNNDILANQANIFRKKKKFTLALIFAFSILPGLIEHAHKTI